MAEAPPGDSAEGDGGHNAGADGEAGASGSTTKTQAGQTPSGALFDIGMLNQGIYFKEAVTDPITREISVTTRVYFPYNDNNLLEGGESTQATRDAIIRVLDQKGILSRNEPLGPHDQKALDTLSEIPTFDPFLLLSKRAELQTERKIDDSYFQISREDWNRIRRPVMRRIAILVAKAHGQKDPSETSAGISADDDEEESGRSMTASVVESIWRGEATQGARNFIRSFQLDESETTRILFAWKGVNYYEYQFKAYEERWRACFKWLASPAALPKDSARLDPGVIDRIQYRRERARSMLRETYRRIALTLQDYNGAFDKLVQENKPADFKRFLEEAPEKFVTLGQSFGVLAHTANAWHEMTQGGDNPLLKSTELDSFYDFVIAINGQDSGG